MKNEFVPYDIALGAKEIGFNEKCLAFYTDDKDLFINKNLEIFPNVLSKSKINAPLYQQLFRWFREEHGFFYFINYLDPVDLNCMGIVARMHKPVEPGYITDSYETYQEAQNACLRKLIEIVNQNKDE
jgi:hypothetical protein